MRILIINPNSDLEMTKTIQKTAIEFAQEEYEVVCKATPGAPVFIETYEDGIKTTTGMIQLVRENIDQFDAVIIACHDDPNIDVLKEIIDKPVIGIGEASMKIATMLGHKFSVLTTSSHSIPIKETQIRKYHLETLLASVVAPTEDMMNLSEEEKYLAIAQIATERDLAEVIVLGCAGMTGLDKKLMKKLKIPVLDGIICALIIATGLIKYKVSTSKKRKYNPNYQKN